MAGLQYNFFPTDFLYPRPPSSATPDAAAATESIVSVVPPKTDDNSTTAKPKGQLHRQSFLQAAGKNPVVEPIVSRRPKRPDF